MGRWVKTQGFRFSNVFFYVQLPEVLGGFSVFCLCDLMALVVLIVVFSGLDSIVTFVDDLCILVARPLTPLIHSHKWVMSLLLYPSEHLAEKSTYELGNHQSPQGT